MSRLDRRRWAALIIIALSLTVAAPAAAHENITDGQFRLTVGWESEPAYSGVKNAVEVIVTDVDGAPVAYPGDALRVDVSYGDERLTLPLLPNGVPGRSLAVIVPSRAGAYSFHILGTISGQPIDTAVSCSDQTFECVTDIGEVALPAKDPSVGQLADRLNREIPRLESARSDASNAQRLAIVALAVGGIALVAGLSLGMRRGRKSS
jgi:hypothetical protein